MAIDTSLPMKKTLAYLSLCLIHLSAAAQQSVSVSYATADGTAKAGTDYTAASGTVK